MKRLGILALVLVCLLGLMTGCSDKKEEANAADAVEAMGSWKQAMETMPAVDPVVGSWHVVALYHEGNVFTVSQMESLGLELGGSMKVTDDSFTLDLDDDEPVKGEWEKYAVRGYDYTYLLTANASIVLNNDNTDVLYFGFPDNESDMMLVFDRDGTNSHQSTVVTDEYAYVSTLTIISNQIRTVDETPQTLDAVDKELQGYWYYYDANLGYHEEMLFKDGTMAYVSWLDSVPEKASGNSATYEVEDGRIKSYFPSTKYTSYNNYTYDGGEMILYKEIDSGADAGNTRIYHHQDRSKAPVAYGYNSGAAYKGGSSTSKNSGGTTTNKSTSSSTSSNADSGKRNALRSAQSYLEVLPFSYTGLIEQLEYEGYSYSEAKYAADNCGADWYEQAVRSAKNYLDAMPFSRSDLIDQLEYEGFTYDQAVYGVNKAY